MKSLFPDICSDALPASKIFYIDLFGFEVLYDLGWYIQLCSRNDKNLQIAFVERKHNSVPPLSREATSGVIITIEVEDADQVYRRALESGYDIFQEICDEAWGQRHFFLKDPNGLLVDIFHMIEPDPDFLNEHHMLEGTQR